MKNALGYVKKGVGDTAIMAAKAECEAEIVSALSKFENTTGVLPESVAINFFRPSGLEDSDITLLASVDVTVPQSIVEIFFQHYPGGAMITAKSP